MSKRKKLLLFSILLLLLLLAGAGWGCWYLFRPENPETAVRRSWKELVALLEKSGGEGLVIQMEKAKTASKKCADPLHVALPQYREAIMSRKDVVQNIFTARKLAETISISVYDMKVRFNNTGEVSLVTFSAAVKGKGVMRGSFHEVREFDTEMVREDGQWLLRKIAFRQVLSR